MLSLKFNFTKIFTSIAIVSIAIFIFSQIFSSAQAATGINRQINFQGKLVNNPAATNVSDTNYTVVFTLYNNPNAGQGTALWTETQTVTTVDGIFRVALGSVNPIPANFNFNWDGLYLGIKVNADSEMTPRVQMAAVPFAFNAEKVAGLTVQDTSGAASTSGTLQIANAKTVSFADAFTTSGAFPLTLTSTGTTNATIPSGTVTLVDLTSTQTLTNKIIGTGGLTFTGATTDITTGTNENFILTPNGSGKIGFNTTSPLATFDIRANAVNGGTLSVASISGTTSFAALVANNDGVGDLFTASKSGLSLFTVKNNGQLVVGAPYYTATCTLKTDNTGLITCGTDNTGSGGSSSPFAEITGGVIVPNNSTVDFLIGGQATTSAKFALINIAGARGTQTASLSGSLTLDSSTASIQTTNNQLLTIGGNTTGQITLAALNGTQNIRFSGYTTAGCTLKTDTSGLVTCGTDNTGSGVNWWNQLAGALSPVDTTNDFLLGSTATSSALFSYTGIKTGQTIASASGQLILMPNNGWGGQVGIGTVTPAAGTALDVRGSGIFGNQLAYDVTAQPNRSKIIYANELTTNTTNDIFSTAGSLEVNPAGATSRMYYGGLYNVVSTSGNAQDFTGRLVGFQGQVSHKGIGTLTQARGFAGLITNDNSGTITNAFAGRFGNTNSSTGLITNAYGVIILSPTNSGGGTYNTNYGLYVQDQSNVGVVGSYNIWSDGFNSKNYFAGSVGIGATPSARLHVAGSWGSNAAVIIDQLNSGDLIAASASGATKFRVANNGDLVLSAAINLGGTNGTSSDCLKGGATAAWGSCGTGSSSSSPFAEITGGVIVPNNSTVDFLIGGQATTSAKFGITGVAAGTPVATLSASTNGNGLVLSGSTSTIQSLKNNALVLGGNTTGDIQFKPGTGMVFIGENEVKSGGLTFYSSGAGETDPSITTDANGNLIFSAPTGTIEFGSGTGNVSLEGDADTSIIASYIGIPAADMFQITNSGQAVTATGVDGLAITYVLGGAGAVTNAGITVDLTTTNNNASTVLRGINIGNITGQASATEVGLRIGTGWDTGISVESGGVTIAAGALAVNSDSITADGATLTINAGGAVDIQDGLTVDSLTIDTADITWSGTTPTITINAAETFTISNGTAADNFVYNTSTNALTLGDGTNGLTFDIDTGMLYQGTGRKTKTITLSPEYSGAILTASGSATITGSMTSDASPSANFRTYYEWSSTSTSLQDYTVAVRVTLPADFAAWTTSSTTMQVNFNTASTVDTTNKLDVFVYNPSTSASIPVVYKQARVSGTGKTWTTVDIANTDLEDSPAWNTAGQTATIYLKMYGSGTFNYTQVGDIVLNYLSAF